MLKGFILRIECLCFKVNLYNNKRVALNPWGDNWKTFQWVTTISWIFLTAYVVRRESYVLTRVCPVCPHPGRGVPHLGYPPIRPGREGVPWQGDTSPRVPAHPPPIRPGRRGIQMGGGGSTPPRVVLDTPRSVCLLRSRRRTFLSSLVIRSNMWYYAEWR